MYFYNSKWLWSKRAQCPECNRRICSTLYLLRPSTATNTLRGLLKHKTRTHPRCPDGNPLSAHQHRVTPSIIKDITGPSIKICYYGGESMLLPKAMRRCLCLLLPVHKSHQTLLTSVACENLVLQIYRQNSKTKWLLFI